MIVPAASGTALGRRSDYDAGEFDRSRRVMS
jgi:hypothetical protein